MSDIFSILDKTGFNSTALENSNLPWRIDFGWSSCDHDNWSVRRNKLRENDIRLDVNIQAAGWKVVLEAKHNLYRVEWRSSGSYITADLPKYSRMTRWPVLDNFLQLPQLILQLQQMPEFKQRKQEFSGKVKVNAYYVDLKNDFNQFIFRDWLGSTLGALLLPVEKIEEEDEEYLTSVRDYPAATTEPGYPFADTNLKLAVMDSLLSEGLLDLGGREDFYRFINHQHPETSKDALAFFNSACNYLSRYPLTNEQLIRVQGVYLDGSSDIYFYIDKFYDGETKEFFINSLVGIEKCPEVTEFHDHFAVENLDLSPLVYLKKLERISLNGSCYIQASSLLLIHSLKFVYCHEQALDKEIVAGLQAKGIYVKSYS